MKISLITVTKGERPDLLERLKRSLDAQTYRDFEWVVVNHRDHPEFDMCLSKARNFGIDRTTGDVLAFPDDDAWYGPNVLEDVVAALTADGLDGVSFRVVDEMGACSAGGWMSAARKRVTKSTVWHTIVSCSFFIKRSAVGNVRFDELLGLGSGTRFGSGEETDFILSVLERGTRIDYDGTRHVHHPRVFDEPSARKGWLYGNGCGLVLRRHHYTVARLAWAVGVQLVRAVQSVMQFRLGKSVFHLAMAWGRISGYFSPRPPIFIDSAA